MPRYLTISLSIVVAIYLAVALTMTASTEDTRVCPGLSIEIEPTPGADGFVTRAEIEAELNRGLPAAGQPVTALNTQQMRRSLLALDKLEDASVVLYTDGSLHVSVKPIVPVARIFDGPESYYVNRSGKRVKASARFRKDVPVISGHFDPADTLFTPLNLIPLLDFIASDSLWNRYISMIEVKGPRDIILVPVIREHVVNIGDLSDIPLKMRHLRTFYSKVCTRKGWECYDTISLKWRGQAVATRRHRPGAELPVSSFDEDEAVSVDAMLAGDGVAPGQALAGRKAHSEIPVPKKKPGAEAKTPATARTAAAKAPAPEAKAPAAKKDPIQ